MADGLLNRLLEDGRRAEEVLGFLNDRYGAGVTEIDEVVKSNRDSIVLRGVFRGQPAIFKRFYRGDVAAILGRMQDELTFLSDRLTGHCRVNRLLAALPEQGLAVLELVPGERVSLILKSDDAARRGDVLRLCGDWLQAVAPLRHEPRKLGRHRLERQFADLSLDGLAPKDRALTLDLIAATRDLEGRIIGTHVTHAIAHGDFAPVNMVSDGTQICAVDIQGGSWFPLARIVARFLVAKDLYSPRPSPRRWGLDADDMAVFAPQRILPETEIQTVLPYFIGQQMVRRFVTTYRDRGGHPQARERMAQCLTDMGRPST